MKITAKEKIRLQLEGRRFGCHVELFAIPPEQGPDDCVKDFGDYNGCVYSPRHKTREACEYWQEVTPENDKKFRHGA